MTSPSSSEYDADQSLRDLAALTPTQLANEIREDAAAVRTHAEAWRNSARWQGDKLDHRAYELIVRVTATLEAIPEPGTYRDLSRYIDAVGPILNQWWVDRPGPQHDLAQAVERLRRTAMHHVGWVADARRFLGHDQTQE